MPLGTPSALRVLVVDDDSIYSEYISSLLGDKLGHVISLADNSESTIAMLENNNFDCIVMDYDLGKENGISIGKLINSKYPDAPPVVMLSGRAKDRNIVKAFRGGVSDFILKQTLTSQELIYAIRGAIERRQKDRDEKSEHARMARLSLIDGLTGMHNAEFMRIRAGGLTASAIRRNGTCAGILIRVHDLDAIADAMGYVVRDRAVKAFAARLQKAARDVDICGQYDDGCFLYLIDREANPQTVTAICHHLSRELTFTVNLDTVGLSLTASIGAALFPVAARSTEELLAVAEEALILSRSRAEPFMFAPALYPGVGETKPWLESSENAAPEGTAAESSETLASRWENRRHEVRHRVFKRGKILMGEHGTVVDCVIRDLSVHGARVRLVEYHFLPERFELVVVGAGAKQAAILRWRSGMECGVQFLL